MFERVRELLLRVLRVPAEPTPPRGARDVRVFRASKRYYRYKLLRWALSQAGTVLGLIAGVVALRSAPGLPSFLLSLERLMQRRRSTMFRRSSTMKTYFPPREKSSLRDTAA